MTKLDRYLLPVLLITPIAMAFTLDNQIPVLNQANIATTTEQPTPQEHITVERMKELYWNVHIKGILHANDPEFTSFALITLDSICPYYTPDGNTYRTCLSHIFDEKIGGRTREQIDMAKSYCSDLVDQVGYEQLAGVNLFLTCAIYRLDHKKRL